MSLVNHSESALKAFYKAHNFLYEFRIHWLPVDPYNIINEKENWRLKYVSQVAYEIGKSEEYVQNHVMRSKDGIAIYDVSLDQYNIILNASDDIPQSRMLWTAVHEIGHIYMGHLKDNKVTKITVDQLDAEKYNQLEFEADIFAGEVLASKWLMRQLDIVDEKDIAMICGISDDAALSRYKKATENYSFVPANAVFTIRNFEDYIKEVTVCRQREDFPLGRFLNQNPVQPKLSKPKPPFLRRMGSCPFCGNEHGITPQSNFCVACGSALKTGPAPSKEYCDHINCKEAAFCEECGNSVYRTKQGFCFEDWEV